jgi:hypothetical protein
LSQLDLQLNRYSSKKFVPTHNKFMHCDLSISYTFWWPVFVKRWLSFKILQHFTPFKNTVKIVSDYSVIWHMNCKICFTVNLWCFVSSCDTCYLKYIMPNIPQVKQHKLSVKLIIIQYTSYVKGRFSPVAAQLLSQWI